MGERLASLQQLLSAQSTAFNQGTVGQRMAVLFDKPGRQPGQLIGKSPYLQSVVVEAPERLIGQIVEVDITSAGPNSLKGSVAIRKLHERGTWPLTHWQDGRSPKALAVERQLTFDQTPMLQAVCGPHDAHLQRLETGLEVFVQVRGIN